MLPLMFIFELNDLMFFIKSMKNPSPHFDITKWIHLNTNVTRSSTYFKLAHNRSRCNLSHHFYFNRLPRLWNSLPPINLDLPITTLKQQLNSTFGPFLHQILTATTIVHIMSSVLAQDVTQPPLPLYLIN